MENNQRHDKIDFKEWLEKLQQESWQLELIISGFAIFGLFRARPFIFEMHQDIAATVVASTAPIMFMSVALIFAWLIFVTNLLLHVFVRGLWIGAIGLRYVSGEIDYEGLGYNKLFTDYYRNKVGTFDAYIERLERLASVIFAYTFLLCFMLMSTMFFFTVLMVIIVAMVILMGDYHMLSHHININHPIPVFIFFVLLFWGFVMLVDFVSMGMLKKIKQRHFAKFFFWMSRIFSIMTLSFLWRPLLLNFLDTKYTKRLLLLSVPYYILLLFVLPSLTFKTQGNYPSFSLGKQTLQDAVHANSFHFQYYDDDREKMLKDSHYNPITTACLPSKRVSGNFLEVFVKSHKSDGMRLEDQSGEVFPLSKTGFLISDLSHPEYYPEEELGIEDSDSLTVEIRQGYQDNLLQIKQRIIDFIEIRIDGEVISNELINYDYYMHPETQDVGMLAFAPINGLTPGRHTLVVEKKYHKLKPSGMTLDTKTAVIPFIKVD